MAASTAGHHDRRFEMRFGSRLPPFDWLLSRRTGIGGSRGRTTGGLIKRYRQLNQIVVEVIHQPNASKCNQPGKYDAWQRAYKNDNQSRECEKTPLAVCEEFYRSPVQDPDHGREQ